MDHRMKNKQNAVAREDVDRAYIADTPGNVILQKSPLGKMCRDELKDTEKHDLICKIAQIMGPSPTNFTKAEMIFDVIKFDLAKYVVHHEYESPRGVSTDLLLWLDSKIDPGKARCVSQLFEKYLK